jgi:DNA-binding SARP family transcriptional activator
VSVRISLTERLAIEANGSIVDEQRFPGRQGRIVFAYLAAQKGRPVPRGELAELLWGDELPATWEKALRVLMTKLRALLDESGIDGATALTSAFGCYKLTLPDTAWIDVDAAADAVGRGEAAFAGGNLADARAHASAAVALARRSFLPGEDGVWVEEKRRELRDLLVRALECLRDASIPAGGFAEAVRHAQEVTELEPFRESSYRRLMEVHAAVGNPAEALRVYERCRRFLADELGAYPSEASEAVYLEILRSSPKSAVADDGAHSISLPHSGRPRKRHRRNLAIAAAAAVVALGAAAVGAIAVTRGDEAPPEVLPTSVVRIDPETLAPTQVVRIGPRGDLVVTAGGYVWVTHGILRYSGNDTLRDAGDRTLTRIDPATGDALVVGGGLAPCGLAADPSGDVWVANCYPSGPGANVVRVDAKTLKFEARWPVPAGNGYYQGLAYGGGSLWVADVSGGEIESHGITELNPRTGKQRSIQFDRHASVLAWSEGYGDLWMDHFAGGSVSRMNAQTGDVKTHELVATNPGVLVVQGDAVWIGDWATPTVVRLPAIGSGAPRKIRLPVVAHPAGVTSVAAGAGAVWATVPDDHAVWRIDLKTNHATRIGLRYFPWGVAARDDGIWVTVRAHDA